MAELDLIIILIHNLRIGFITIDTASSSSSSSSSNSDNSNNNSDRSISRSR
jgi:hypothetical protein